MKLVIHFEGSSIRGNERQLLIVARGLYARGHDVVASCRAESGVRDALDQEGIRTSTVRPTGDMAVTDNVRFAQWLKDERPDAILLTSWRKALVAGWASRNANIPRIVLRVGGQHTPHGIIDRWKYRHALTAYYDAIIANSTMIADHLVRIIPELRREIIHTVANGITPAQAQPASLRGELGLDDDSVLIMSTGGLDKRKGFDLLINAAAQLEPNVHIAIAGEGNERSSLEALARSLDIEGRVHFLGQRSDVESLLPGVDLFVISSRGEGMSVAMLEAMAARRPIVSTNVGGVDEALGLRDRATPAGWIVPRNDAEALVRALRDVLSSMRTAPETVRSRVDEAAWRMQNWFTSERMVEDYERVLDPLRSNGVDAT